MQKTKLEIIEDTCKFYMADPTLRATTVDEECFFEDSEGRCCAVGRYLLPDLQEKVDLIFAEQAGITIDYLAFRINSDTYYPAKTTRSKDFDPCLKPEYRGHCVNFWRSLQNFHDNPDVWVNKDATLKAYQALLDRWSLGEQITDV